MSRSSLTTCNSRCVKLNRNKPIKKRNKSTKNKSKLGSFDCIIDLYEEYVVDEIAVQKVTISCMKSDPTIALELFTQMKTIFNYYKVNPDFITYSVAISICERSGMWNDAIELLHEAISLNMFLDNCLTDHSVLDLHADKILSASSKKYTVAVSFSIAKVILLYRFLVCSVPPTIIIFGRHGNGVLRRACLSFLSDNKISNKYIEGDGRVIVFNKR